MSDRLEPDVREAYKEFVSISTRWMDNDAYGHVNNAVYYSWFDTAVNGFLIERGLLESHASDDVIGLVVSTKCQYFMPVSFPTPVEIGLRIARIGSSSVDYELGVFSIGRHVAHARGTFTHAIVDRSSHRPVTLPARHRAILEACYA